MKAEAQWFLIESNGGVSFAGSVPTSRIAKKTGVAIEVCYYWPIDYSMYFEILVHMYSILSMSRGAIVVVIA